MLTIFSVMYDLAECEQVYRWMLCRSGMSVCLYACICWDPYYCGGGQRLDLYHGPQYFFRQEDL